MGEPVIAREVIGHSALLPIVERYYEAVDANDLETALTLFAPDAVYHRPGYAPMHGRVELRRFYSRVRMIKTGCHDLRRVLCLDEMVVVEGSFSGLSTTGERLNVRFADFFQGSRTITSRRTYFYTGAV